MIIYLDPTLCFWVEVAVGTSLNGNTSKHHLFPRVLREFEECGSAMRFLDTQGNIAWKCSPRMNSRLADLERDAEEDLEDLP
jgi:hypothetical protein